MEDEEKTKEQLLKELEKLRQRISGLEATAAEHLHLEKTLTHAAHEKQAILDSLLEHVVYQDMEMRVLWANQAACESVAMTREELLGHHCYEIWADRSAPCEDCPVKLSRETGQPHALEKRTPDGRSWFIQGSAVLDTNGVIVGAVELTLDITKRKQTEEALQKAHDELEHRVRERTAELLKTNEQLKREIHEREKIENALRESEGTLKAILAASPVGIGLVRNRNLDWANTAMYRILGYHAGSLLGEDGKRLYLDDKEWDRVGRRLFTRVDAESIGQTETRWITKEGAVIDCYLQSSPLDPNDRGRGHIVAAMDITDRKRAEERIHALTHELMKAQENERQRISLYLHDDVAQNLSTLKIGLETIFDDPQASPPALRQKAAELSQILQAAISAVRDLAYDQRPPSLDQLGLIQAVFQYCEAFSEEQGIKVDFQSAGMDNLTLDFDTEISFYRLIQEALTNVRKHAEARQVIIRLVAAHPHIILRIEDDGKGFDVQRRSVRALDEKRMGLQSLEERVHLLNGKLRIQSRLGEGTNIFVEVPYKEKRVG